MGSIAGIKVGTMNEEKSKRGTNNRNVVQGDTKEGSRFWRQMRFFLSYMCLSSKEEGSSIDKNKQGRKSTNENVGHQTVSRSSSTKRSRSSERSCTSNLDNELTVASHLLRRFTFLDLMLATRNFRAENFLGVDGSGTVLIGWVSQHGNFATRPETGIQVVVKTLNLNRFQDPKEWLADISYLSELHHPNLVKLVGFCIEDDKRLLVYEYVCGGSLENHLFNRSMCLPWSIRMKIAIGAAKGLAFLHEEISKPITFQDFKLLNILLDENYNAKLAGFGLSNDNAPVGTQGYAAPEYVMTGQNTLKSNVYSFGVVLLELLTGRRAMDNMHEGGQNLLQWLRPLLRDKENFIYLMDIKLNGEFCLKSARRVMRLATHCIRHDPQARPLMSEVVRKLKSLHLHNDGIGLRTCPLANVP